MFNFHLIKFLLVFLVLTGASSSQATPKEVSDDFEIKGFHLDLRIQVMTPQALKSFAKELADFGINTLVMEWEGTYPFKKHAIIANQYAYSREEVNDFIAYCDSLGISVIPLQQTLGHVEYILRHPRYSLLKEDRKDISQLCPMETDASKALFKELFADLADTHHSDYIHIGGDETYLLGHCEKCARKVAEAGKSKLFVDHMKMIAQLVVDLGKTPIMWADIILKYPEAVAELPDEVIFVDWNYGWKTNHFGDVAALQQQGFTFWGAPSIRCHPDNWYVTDWMTHFNNQRDFIPYSREAGYRGMVMTSWSTTGVYGFIWDVGYDVIDMIQVRNTYPLAGFRILIASYAQALASSEPLDAQAFVYTYGKDRFGLTATEADALWSFFAAPPVLITDGKPADGSTIEMLIQNYTKVQQGVNTCSPKRNQREFEHFKLMVDLRMHYLAYKAIEAKYNAADFDPAQTPELLTAIHAILADADVLNQRFEGLMSGFLYPAEIAEQNRWRVEQVHVLYHRLAKLKDAE
ncbi:family 20 glycosylhydrolase [Parapedobacter sp. ISTM3]|uniref:DUF4838 domain-containing protein n=1 Tax=Parapedobacter sp. ISTM3 TaxID=2800130 RepID=UPI0019037527|nr:DUF4838 domain-containing protein [Parapedobacter sp. ISTM3]MBK1440889.1 family 20 glycosylhydrolase [Parapedobacter sp. ISTM3]